MKSLFIFFLLALLANGCASGPSKSDLDAEVRRLCAIDGGIKVYETVRLPAEQFDSQGFIKFFRAGGGENALGTDYLYREKDTYLLKGEYEAPAMWKNHLQVIRRSDMKILGESISYTRRGGDLPGPWHPSSYICPELKDQNLLERIFSGRQQGDKK